MKNKYIRLGLLFLFVTILVIPGFVAAENKEFQRYFFKDGTFYKHTASTVDEYFQPSQEKNLVQVNWKAINQQVLALREEKKVVQKTEDHDDKNEESEVVLERVKEKPKPPTKSSSEKITITQSEFEQEVIRLTNIEREKQGLRQLKPDKKLAEVARKKSQDMATENYFSHNSPTYGSPFDMMNDFRITYYSAGENIAMGQTTPQEVVQAWMDSEGHRENILYPDYTHIGVGFSEDGFYWAQAFIKRLDDSVNQEEFENQVIALTNQERAKHGLEPLLVDAKLAEVARAKSLDMAKHEYFDHISLTYGSPFEMMEQFGVPYHTAGENIARGQFTPEEVVEAWMNSEGHRANILNPNYTHIGVGFVKEDIIWTQQFIGK